MSNTEAAETHAPATQKVRTKQRDQLFVQIHEVFVRYGYDGATLANLAAATGLSKASLYHHFPGGKPEMAASLVRFAIAELHKQAFSNLLASKAAGQQLSQFIEGFASYCQHGKSNCMLAIISHHASAADNLAPLQADIATQFADWRQSLADTFEQAGAKPKKARRQAQALLATLYGALLSARLQGDPDIFMDVVKQQKKTLSAS